MSAAANAAANAQDGRSAALKAAAQWHALLCSGTAGQEDQDACDAWRGRHPDHAWAWERLQALRQDLGSVPGPLSRATLQGAGRASGRRAFVKGIAVAAPTAVLAWGMTRSSGWQVWRADLRTATGEQRRVTLPDDSTLVLNTDSAVSLRFTAQERRIRLLAGEVYIETAHGAAAHGRPFIVESAQGNAQALGTRFTVRESNGAGAADVTRVAVQDGAVRILPGGSGQAQVVRAGQRVTYSWFEVQAVQAEADDSDWTRGMLVVDDWALGDVVRELARYRSGWLACDPAVARLRVSGAYPVPDTDRALDALRRAFPLKLAYRTRYWVTVLPA